MCVCVCVVKGVDYRGGGGREARGPLQQCGYRRNWEARPEGEVCAVCVCVCVNVCVCQRGRGDAFSGSLCYQLSPKLWVVPPPAWQVICFYGDKQETAASLSQHKYAHLCLYIHVWMYMEGSSAIVWHSNTCDIFLKLLNSNLIPIPRLTHTESSAANAQTNTYMHLE